MTSKYHFMCFHFMKVYKLLFMAIITKGSRVSCHYAQRSVSGISGIYLVTGVKECKRAPSAQS